MTDKYKPLLNLLISCSVLLVFINVWFSIVPICLLGIKFFLYNNKERLNNKLGLFFLLAFLVSIAIVLYEKL